MTTYQKRFWVIVTVIVLVAGGSLAAYLVAGRASARQVGGFCAEMEDSLGLYAGNPVTQMGYKVGEVTSIDAGDTSVRVSFDLTSARTFPAGLKAVTRSKSVLADRSLELVGNYTDGATLEPGTCIPLQNSFTPESISEIAGSTADLIDAVAPADGEPSVQGSIAGLADTLQGTGPQIAELMRVAASAAQNPDKIVSDIGTIITNMAPLSTDALSNWDAAEQILAVLPESAETGADVLWPGTQDMPPGMTPILQALYDIQNNYGEYIWPAAGALAGALHIAAGRVGDVQQASLVLPVVAEQVALTASPDRGVALQVEQPKIAVRSADPKALCAGLNLVRRGSCTVSGQGADLIEVGVFDLLLAGVVR